MLEPVHYVEFHSPLFHAGKNFGTKVEVHKHQGLTITYDDDLSLFNIEYKGRMAKCPWTSAFLWEPKSVVTPIPVVVNEHRTQDASKRKGAQVSTPMGHVFEGPGAGKTK